MADKRLVAILQNWYWDPVPPWLRLDPGKLERWNEIANKFATQLADIQAQKIEALEKLTGKKF